MSDPDRFSRANDKGFAMPQRGNGPRRHGQAHYRATLSDDDVDLIRDCYAAGGFTYASLAEKFNCGASTIRDIVKCRTRVRRSA